MALALPMRVTCSFRFIQLSPAELALALCWRSRSPRPIAEASSCKIARMRRSDAERSFDCHLLDIQWTTTDKRLLEENEGKGIPNRLVSFRTRMQVVSRVKFLLHMIGMLWIGYDGI